MKILLTLIFLILTFNHANSQIMGNYQIYCETIFSEENRNNIRIENIKRHLNYLEAYNRLYNDTTFCHKLKTGFVDYEEIFGVEDFSSTITEDILDQMKKSNFYIWPYDNSHFEIFNTYIFKKTTLLKGYSFFIIYDKIFENSGVIAVNDTNYNEVLFIGGNYLPLDNIFPSFNPFNERLRHIGERRTTIPGSVYWYENELKIPLHKHSMENVFGYEHYANMLSVFFISPFALYRSLIEEYDDRKNEFTVKVTAYFYIGFSDSTYKRPYFEKPPCLWDKDRHIKILRYCTSTRPNIPCNCYNGEVVSSMLVKFNTDTKRIQFKINETVDISEFQECPY